MFELLDDYYTQDIRIDLASAECLSKINPNIEHYQNAARDGEFVVSVLQGDAYTAVYVLRIERIFATLEEARQFILTLIKQYPGAATFDFVERPCSESAPAVCEL